MKKSEEREQTCGRKRGKTDIMETRRKKSIKEGVGSQQLSAATKVK